MRSAIFNKFAALSKDFERDMDTFWQQPPDTWEQLGNGALELHQSDTLSESKIALERIAGSIQGNRADILKSLALLGYICTNWNPFRDTPEIFIKDLEELSLIPADKEKEAIAFLTDFFEKLQKDNFRRQRKKYAISLLPNYKSISTLVDFRPIFDHPFGTGLDDNIKDYKPNCVGWVPIVLLRLNNDEDESLEVQCEEKDINIIIESLQAALKNLTAAKTQIPSSEDD